MVWADRSTLPGNGQDGLCWTYTKPQQHRLSLKMHEMVNKCGMKWYENGKKKLAWRKQTARPLPVQKFNGAQRVLIRNAGNLHRCGTERIFVAYNIFTHGSRQQSNEGKSQRRLSLQQCIAF